MTDPAIPAPPPDFDADAWLDATAPALGLTVESEWRDGVIGYLRLTAAMAETVNGFPLDDREEPAPVFRP